MHNSQNFALSSSNQFFNAKQMFNCMKVVFNSKFSDFVWYVMCTL